MVVFVLFMIALAVIEIMNIKEKSINVILPYLLIAVFATALGIFYFSEPFRPSLAFNILKLLGVKY